MNPSKIFAHFPSYEKQYYIEQNIKDRQKKEKLKIIQRIKLLQDFPHIKYEDLIQQNTEWETDDGCTHFKDNITKQIFSWDFIHNNWMQHDLQYQHSLRNLFQ